MTDDFWQILEKAQKLRAEVLASSQSPYLKAKQLTESLEALEECDKVIAKCKTNLGLD